MDANVKKGAWVAPPVPRVAFMETGKSQAALGLAGQYNRLAGELEWLGYASGPVPRLFHTPHSFLGGDVLYSFLLVEVKHWWSRHQE